eukprot:s8568_g2.t1
MKVLRLGDKYIQHVLKLVSHRDYRFSKETCVVTGTKLVRDLGKRYRFKEIICSRPSHPDLATLNFDELHLTEPRILRKIAELEEFDGLIGTLTLPARRTIKEITHPRLVLCLDYIEDPGLMGTLLRTAVSFQWQAVFFLPNCGDPFSSRCLRASQGALFNIPHCKGNMEDLHKLCRRGHLTLSVPHPAGVDVSSEAYEPPKGQALLLREEQLHMGRLMGKLMGGFWVTGGLWEVYGRRMGGLWEAYGRLMGSFSEAYGKLMGGLWEAMGGLWEAYGRLMGGLWKAYGKLMGGLWGAYQKLMGGL